MPSKYQPDNHPKNPKYLSVFPTTEQIDNARKAIANLSRLLDNLDEHYDIFGYYPRSIWLDNKDTYDDE